MKKNALVLLCGIVMFASCKKDYECKVNDVTVLECIDCNSEEKTTLDASCGILSGVVTKK